MNKYLLEYALSSLFRSKLKNSFIFVIFTFLVFVISSVFFITNGIKYELSKTIEKLPQITIQKLQAGRIVPIDVSLVDKIITITGVGDCTARVWGYYFYENAGVNFSIVGIDQFEKQYTQTLQDVVDKNTQFEYSFSNEKILIGSGVQKILKENYFKDYFNFILSDGGFKKIYIGGVFDSSIQMQTNDMILVNRDLAHEILGYNENEATDIIVKVTNPLEIDTIVSKIKLIDPNTRVLRSEDFKVSYQNIFDYKSGVFLVLFITSLSAFFILVFDKASGLNANEKKEIGILKAVGWKTQDVLQEKFYESFIISSFAFLLGLILGVFFVYFFQAPVLRAIFEGYSVLKTTFELPFVFDFQTIALVFFVTIPLYIAATIVPAYKASITDADEIIR